MKKIRIALADDHTLILDGLQTILESVEDMELFISNRTVDTHRTNLMKKLDVHHIEGLIHIAYRNKLVQ